MINIDKLAQIVSSYKKQFLSRWENEKFKWEAIKHFQDNWDINALNFGEMFKKATDKTNNLLSAKKFQPKDMILKFAQADDNAVRDMFICLFDESLDLSERIEFFINAADNLYEKYNDGTWKNHFQNTYTVSVYLWLMYPHKYYIYKYELFKNFAELLETSYYPKRNGKVYNVIGGYKMYDEIREVLLADKDIREMLDSVLTDSCYKDPELVTTTIDLGFYLSKTYSQEVTSDNDNTSLSQVYSWLLAWNPKNYDWENIEEPYSLDTMFSIIRNGGGYFDCWRCMSSKIECGDLVYIVKLGKEPKGIFAAGYAISDSIIENDERVVYVLITKAIDYRTDNIISQQSLKELFPNQQWSPQGSGIAIKPDAAKWLIENWNSYQKKPSTTNEEIIDTTPPTNEPYTKSDFLKEVFITGSEYDKLSSLLLRKKNIILQGAPGVGKTFSAKRLAYSIMGEKNDDFICMVQFHQNYSYEDFIMGYRPNDSGGFSLQKGVFFNFCDKCKENPGKEYFFIIDEINRGNLSKIFGELMMLIETDKRGEANKLNLVYEETPFYIPENLHIIGMMNTADRSLAMIDYALRRRFSFYTMQPAFENAENNGFNIYRHEINCEPYHSVISKIKELNVEIRKDPTLGKGFEIGHSYFAPEDKSIINDEWVKNIVEFEIIPLLEEYWFDDDKKVEEWTKALYQVSGEQT